jgi:hypothetical protein
MNKIDFSIAEAPPYFPVFSKAARIIYFFAASRVFAGRLEKSFTGKRTHISRTPTKGFDAPFLLVKVD